MTVTAWMMCWGTAGCAAAAAAAALVVGLLFGLLGSATAMVKMAEAAIVTLKSSS